MPVRIVRPWFAALLLVSPVATMAQQEVAAPAGPPAVEPAMPVPPAAAPGAYAPSVAPMPRDVGVNPGYGQMMDPGYGAAMTPGYGPAMTPEYGQMPYGYGGEQMAPGMMMPQMMHQAGQYPEMVDPYGGMQRPAMPGMGRGLRAGQASGMPQREAFHRSIEAKLDEILGRLERIEQMLKPTAK